MSSEVDVIVVGAGISGLVVARELVAAGLEVSVFEARDRVGGRLHSPVIGGHRLDVGATWFWPNEPRVAHLNSELNLASHKQFLAGDAMFDDPSGPQRLEGNPIDVASNRWTRGAQSLAEAVAEQLPNQSVKLNLAVETITARSQAMEVTTTDGVTLCRHVVVALPPALAVHGITFEPGLDSAFIDLARTTPVWMGAITKVVALYDRPFWRDLGLAGSGFSHIGPIREIHDMSGPDGAPAALFGFAPPSAEVTEENVKAQLGRLFGQSASKPEALMLMSWRSQPWTSPPGVEQQTDYSTYGHPSYAVPMFDGRLHWSSTETANTAPGHVEGALQAAERTAKAILSAE